MCIRDRDNTDLIPGHFDPKTGKFYPKSSDDDSKPDNTDLIPGHFDPKTGKFYPKSSDDDSKPDNTDSVSYTHLPNPKPQTPYFQFD